jgi:hypothetical protein
VGHEGGRPGAAGDAVVGRDSFGVGLGGLRDNLM